MKLLTKNVLTKIINTLTIMVTIAAIMLSKTGILKVYAEETTAREYHIAQDGTGNFSTIQEGVDHAKNGDTLVIHPGTYNEHVSIIGKELHLKGTDRDTCIIQYDTADYRNATLVMAAGGVSNLTIIGLDTGRGPAPLTQEETEQMPPEIWEGIKNYTGYAIHIEQDYLFQRQIVFSNCNIISQHNYCAGIGGRGGCKILFENCSLTAVGIGGCILMHDSIAEQFAGESSLVMRDCSMKSFLNPYVMAFQSLRPYNSFRLTFQHVKTSAMAYADDTIYQECSHNTSPTVEELADCEKSGTLGEKGFTTSADKLVHILDSRASAQYISGLNSLYAAKDYKSIMSIDLPEGIVYIDEDKNADSRLRHQVISIENSSGQPEEGWCGLHSAYLTPDSYGNILVEMNTSSMAFQ